MSEVVPESLPARLAIIVGRFNRRLALAPGLSHGLLTALASVAKQGPLRLAELAQLEGISPPGATRVVAELESRGLVARSIDPDDGRAFRIQVTPAGNEAIAVARAARAQIAADLLECLDSNQIASIEAALPALERTLGL
jgi:DNA-binding MarR family transcriptional regulator